MKAHTWNVKMQCLEETNTTEEVVLLDDFQTLRAENEALKTALDGEIRENIELKARLKAEEWRPIEEAPKDGRFLILYNQDWSGRITTGSWTDQYGWGDEHIYTFTTQPTHFRPLPQPPEVK